MTETVTDRKKRLAEQLRANLRRRKTQGRQLEEQASLSPGKNKDE
jgi:hypothetical protein